MTINPTWTAELREAAFVLAGQRAATPDIASRASEIAQGARVGAVLTDMNVEFITAMRSRFEPYGDAVAVAAQRRFDDLWRDAWEAAKPAPVPVPSFEGIGWDGSDPGHIKRDGFTVTATTYPDDDPTPPWNREDGHGGVRTAPRGNEAEGERVMTWGNHRHYYAWDAAIATATAEGWGPTPEEAVQADYNRLQAWCENLWGYIGVAVTVSRNGIQLTGKYGNAVWGIESDAGAYLAQTADEMTGAALDEARQILADLIEGDGDQ